MNGYRVRLKEISDNITAPQLSIVIALIEEHLEFTDLKNIYNDDNGESFSFEDVIKAFPSLPKKLINKLKKEHDSRG